MRRPVFILMPFAALALLCPLVAAQAAKTDAKKTDPKTIAALPPYKGPKKRIAVMNMEVPPNNDERFREFAEIFKSVNGISTPGDVGKRLTEMLTTALDSTGRFVLLERAAIGDIKSEMAIGEELGNEKTAVKKGNVLGAQMLIRAAVTEFTANKKTRGGGISLGNLRLGGADNEAAVVLDLRFIDPNTSQVLYTAKAEGSSKATAVVAGLTIGGIGLGGGQAERQPIERATRNAIEKAVLLVIEKMDPLPWEARIAKVNEDGTLVLNRGLNDGLKIGDTLRVYKPGETIKDPETDEVLGRDEDVLVGEATVTWISDRLARASFSGSGTPGANYVLKLFVK